MSNDSPPTSRFGRPGALWHRLVARVSVATGNRGGMGVIVRNFAWLSGDRVLRMGLQFLVGAIVARYLGAAGFGSLNYALAIVGLISVFAGLGFDGIFSRELLRFPERANSIIGTVFWTRLAVSLLLYGGIAVYALTQPPDLRATLLVSGLSFLGAPLLVFNTQFEIRLQARYTVWAANAAFILCTVVRFWLVARRASVAAFAGTYLIEPVIIAVALYGFYRRDGGRVRHWRWESPLMWRLLNESWPLLLSGLAVTVYMRIDQVMLAQLRGDAELGIFSAALRLSEVWYFIPMTLASSLFPTLVRSRELAPAAYRKRLTQFYDLNAGLAYVIILSLSPFATWLFALVYGHSFAGSAGVFQIHLWACLFVFLGVARGQFLLNEGFTRFAFLSTTAGAVCNVGLNFFLIPHYGARGAAAATIISQAASTFFSSFVWAPTRANGFEQLRSMLLPLRVIGWGWQRYIRRAGTGAAVPVDPVKAPVRPPEEAVK